MTTSGNPLATLLLTAPLLVVPTVAALGLPSSDADPVGLVENDFALGDGAAGGGFGEDLAGLGGGFDDLAAATPGAADPFDGVAVDEDGGDAGDGLFADSAAAPDAGLGDVPFGGSAAAANAPADLAAAFPADDAPAAGPRTAEVDRPRDPLTETTVRVEPPAVGPADLPGLSRQLKSMGATRLSLEPGAAGFYFGCTLAEIAGGATIARRFEAEAPTAAAAVADVVAQVRRYRSAGSVPAGDVAFAGATP